LARNVCLLILCFACCFPAATRADDDAVALDLAVDPCLAETEASMRDILNIEIATLAAIDTPTPGTDLGARLRCDGTTVLVTVWDHRTGQVLEERVAVDDPGAPGTARTLALALAELVAIMRPPPTPADPVDGGTTWPSPEHSRSHLHMLGVLRAAVASAPWMGGAALEVSYDVQRWLRVVAGAEWVSGAAGTPLGRIRGTSLTGLAAISLGSFHRRFRFGVDAGLRAGMVRWNGRTDQDDVATGQAVGPFVGVLGRAGLELPLSDRLHLRTALEIGAVLAGSRGQAVREAASEPDVIGEVGFDRWWVTATLGVTLAL
jgi:hypothetical protein